VGFRIGNSANLYDEFSGLVVGFIDENGQEQLLSDSVSGVSLGQFNALAAVVDGQGNAITALGVTVSSLSGTVAGHTTSINTLNSTVSGLSSTVAGHTTSIATLNSTVSGLSTTVTTLSGTVVTLSSSVTNLTTIVGNVDNTIAAVGDGVANNDAVFSAAVSEFGSFVTAGKTTARFRTQGLYKFFSPQDVHPSISLMMGSRGGILIVPDGNMSSGTTNGAQGAVLRNIRRTPASGSTVAYGFAISGVNIDGRGVTFASGAFTVNAGTDVFTATAHGRPNGYGLYLSGTSLVASGLSGSKVYFVINATTNTFQLSLTPGGAAVDVTVNTSGAWYTAPHGLRVPNSDPSKNSADPDPTFAGNKDYVAGRYEFGDIIGMPGTGLLIESTNGRADIHSFRCLNNGQAGFDLGGNDIVMSGHWASGGNAGFGLKVGDASGFFATTGNLWGLSSARSLTCGSEWINLRKLFAQGFCEFNDWLRMTGGHSFWRGGVIALNCFAPYNDLFTGDGVAIDTTTGGPDPRLQAHIGIEDYQTANFIGNQFFRTTDTAKNTPPFATWMSVGGSLDGSNGTAMQNFIDASNDAMVNTIDTVNTGPNTRGWTGPQATFTASGDTMLSTAHGLLDGYQVALTSTNTLPGGLNLGIPLFVILVDSDHFKLAYTPGGTPITTSGAGTGTHKWGLLTTLPYATRTGGQINYQLMDSFACEQRFGARGPAHSRLLFGLADTDFAKLSSTPAAGVSFATGAVDTVGDKITSTAHGLKDNYPLVFTTSGTLPGGLSLALQFWVVNSTTNDFQVTATPGGLPIDLTSVGSGTHVYYSWWRTYAIEMGDRTAPSGNKFRNAIYGLTEFGNAPLYLDTAHVAGSFTNGQTKTITAGQKALRATVAGGGIAGGTIQLTTDLNASQETEIFVLGGPITALAWTVGGGGSISTGLATLPTSTSGPFYVKLWYDRSVNTWYPQVVLRADNPFITLAGTSGAIASDCSLSENFVINLAGNGTLANPTNPQDGKVYRYYIIEDATGGRTWGYSGSKILKNNGTLPTFTTTANAINFVALQYMKSVDKFFIIESGNAYA
jgi:hypothetical protein